MDGLEIGQSSAMLHGECFHRGAFFLLLSDGSLAIGITPTLMFRPTRALTSSSVPGLMEMETSPRLVFRFIGPSFMKVTTVTETILASML